MKELNFDKYNTIDIIKNKNEVGTTELRKKAISIIEAGIRRVLPQNTMKSVIKYDAKKKVLSVNNNRYIIKGRIFVIGGGKSVGNMAETLEDIVGHGNIEDGIVNCKSSKYRTKKIKIVKAGHPIPNQKSVEGVRQMLNLKKKYSINKDDLIICLLSGGGSALMSLPIKSITLEDKRKINELLINCGAQIHEINAVRKHISQVKGGRLGNFYFPTTIVSLIISDVIGNDLSVIASGPTYQDHTSFQMAYNVLKNNNILSKAPKSIVNFLKKGCIGEIEKTSKIINNCDNYIIANNKMALEAMKIKAEIIGFKPYIVTSKQKGNPEEAARQRAKEIFNEKKYSNYNVILIGGETAPELPKKHGKGGRNQHFVAVSMIEIKKYNFNKEWVLVSVGTDGEDYCSDAAGAVIDNNSLKRLEDKNINVQSYIDNYNSYELFKKIRDSLISTNGATGTNVCDIMMYIYKK